jgi:hypothetical protein
VSPLKKESAGLGCDMRCISVERRPSGSIEHAVDPWPP